MVFGNVARLDADNLFFNGDKTVLYHVVTEVEDLTYGSKKLTYTTYSLPIQGGILSWADRMVKQGILMEGDSAGVLRYEYTVDAYGNSISPTLYPKPHDELSLLGRRFRINTLTPTMSEDHANILFNFQAKPVSTNDDLIFPLEFPIQF